MHHPLSERAKAGLAVTMAWVAGFVDVVAWLTYDHVYVSHMTGNTASLAHALSLAEWARAFRYGWPFIPFMTGLLWSAASSKWAKERGIHSSVSIALFTEVVLLIIAMAAGKRELATITALAAAMGVQTVTVTRVNGLRVYTTYVTGTLSKFAEAVINSNVEHALLTAGLWVGFLLGALCGALGEEHYSLWSLGAPMGVIAIVAAIDLLRPISAADEPTERWSAH